MGLFKIALSNIIRRKRKMSFLVVGLLVGVATVVALISIVAAMRLELGNELDKFGPNIVITPRFQGLELNYGQQVTEVLSDVKPLTASDVPLIKAIPDGDSINLYYGGADTSMSLATGSIKQLLRWIDEHGVPPA